MASSKVLEDLDLSTDEVKRLGEALKDETFRKMLVEYAEEISNPENRRKAEEEIAIMENERGMSVQFIHPEPGYVLKTTVDGSKKAFINICQNDKIEKPKAKKQIGPDGKKGVMWQIPHSFAPPRDDYDKNHQVCSVFDVVFHPDTYRMAMSNERFKKLVEDTAVDGIESQFGVKLDKKNIRHPKLKFKGIPQATVIRERLDQKASNDTPPDTSEQDDILSKMPYPYDNKTSAEKSSENQHKHAKNTKSDNSANSDSCKFTVPKYTITHRSEVDMSEYRNAADAKTSTCPKELVIKIELPLLNSAAQASLDIFEKKLILESVSPAAYKLDLSLPYQVNEDEGSAKFDKSKRTLTVTLPVVPPKTPPLPFSGNSENYFSETNIPVVEDLSADVTADSPTIDNTPQSLVQDSQVRSNGTGSLQNGDIECDNKLTFPNNIHWILPNYQFSQDNETVSFVINVKNVEQRTVEMVFPQSCAAVVQFVSIGAGCFPVYYRLCVQFPDACKISEHCSVDVSDSNLVFVILKDKTCRGLWDSFSIGVDEHQLEEKQFLTESNLQRQLADLDKEALNTSNMPGQVEMTPELSVVEMSEKRLTIDIKPPKGRRWKVPDTAEEEEEDDCDPPSSAEIEVIHKNPPPDLHSILKQRTMSESSEEISTPDPDSPRSEGEELSSSFGKKRSVSFNNHVDRASFKSSASVSSMTPGLKSKRRRQRKREEKKKGHVRCNSEGTSSSEEYLHSVSDSYSLSEEEVDVAHKKSKGGKRACLYRAASDPGPDAGGLSPIAEREKGSGEPRRQTGKKKSKFDFDGLVIKSEVPDFRTNVSANGEGVDGVKNVNDSQENFPHEMSVGTNVKLQVTSSEKMDVDNMNGSLSCEEKKTLDKNKKIISEIKSKLCEGNIEGKREQKDDSDDDDFVDAVSSLAAEFKTKLDLEESGGNCHSELLSGTGNGKFKPLTEPPNPENNCLIEEIEPAKDYKSVAGTASKFHSKNGENNDGERCSLQHEKSGVETMLSWKEGGTSNEHVTNCAVQFSNSLMFDLDIEGI
ncbi:unnamed protein product [Candidula unifasciata]|uniref:Protein kintoun n=1 Tax=Candidula unifasciata TaxID=100452 RepID=A0A8S3YF48_9EUPU|nr:unnamed protein product [Candidula unifasciata]